MPDVADKLQKYRMKPPVSKSLTWTEIKNLRPYSKADSKKLTQTHVHTASI
jgi:hypothetical protein